MNYACKLHPKNIIIKRKVAVNDQIFDIFFLIRISSVSFQIYVYFHFILLNFQIKEIGTI